MKTTRYIAQTLIVLPLACTLLPSCLPFDRNSSPSLTSQLPLSAQVKGDVKALRESFDAFREAYQIIIKSQLSRLNMDSRSRLDLNDSLDLKNLNEFRRTYNQFKQTYSNLEPRREIEAIEKPLNECVELLQAMATAVSPAASSEERKAALIKIQRKVSTKNIRVEVTGQYNIETSSAFETYLEAILILRIDHNIGKIEDLPLEDLAKNRSSSIALTSQQDQVQDQSQDQSLVQGLSQEQGQQQPQDQNVIGRSNPFIDLRSLISAALGSLVGIGGLLTWIYLRKQHFNLVPSSRKSLSSEELDYLFLYVDELLKQSGLDKISNNQVILKRTFEDRVTSLEDKSKKLLSVDAQLKQLSELSDRIDRLETHVLELPTPIPTTEPPRHHRPSSVPGNGDWEEWIKFYNDNVKQDSGEVKKYFLDFQFASELIEIEASVARRRRAVVNFGGVELMSVALNRGTFWIVASKGEGWVFPILGKRGRGYWDAINSLFKVVRKSVDYKYIEIQKPAIVLWSDNKVWKLEQKGEICLRSDSHELSQTPNDVILTPTKQNPPGSQPKLETRMIELEQRLRKRVQALEIELQSLVASNSPIQHHKLEKRIDDIERQWQELSVFFKNLRG